MTPSTHNTTVAPSVEIAEPSGLHTPREPTPAEKHPLDVEAPIPQRPPVKGIKFWLVLVSLMVSTFVSAIDLTSVSTALPTIIEDLHGTDFVWVGSAFSLGSTAILPLTGGLAQIFGRRPIVLASLALFVLGSGISGGSSSMTMLISARTIQGIGGGGILSLSEIVLADLVPLKERGAYMGMILAVWAVACAAGPPIGGAFAQSNWRWLFYMNIPLGVVAMTLVFFFLDLKVPKDDFKTKMRRMDWIGSALIIASTSIQIVALTWAGVTYPWSSYKVLVPLILGILGTVAFFFYEARYAKEPIVPWDLVANRTSFSGYLATLIHGFVMTGIIYYLPTYFQGARLEGPVRSGVTLFGVAFTIAPAAIICGGSVTILNFYKPQNFVGWALASIALGLLSLLDENSKVGTFIGFEIIAGFGLGVAFAAPTFPVLAPLTVQQTAHALALFTFARSYAQTWGVTVGATILQNELTKNLPADFLFMFSSSTVEIAYAAIPNIPGLAEPLRTEVRKAFADSIRVIWYLMAALAVVGFLSVALMREIPMHDVTDEDWGMDGKDQKADIELA